MGRREHTRHNSSSPDLPEYFKTGVTFKDELSGTAEKARAAGPTPEFSAGPLSLSTKSEVLVIFARSAGFLSPMLFSVGFSLFPTAARYTDRGQATPQYFPKFATENRTRTRGKHREGPGKG